MDGVGGLRFLYGLWFCVVEIGERVVWRGFGVGMGVV